MRGKTPNYYGLIIRYKEIVCSFSKTEIFSYPLGREKVGTVGSVEKTRF